MLESYSEAIAGAAIGFGFILGTILIVAGIWHIRRARYDAGTRRMLRESDEAINAGRLIDQKDIEKEFL